MKIRSIKIGSFGAAANLNIDDIKPGLNVFYGKNESGKTTVMEFIRSTLFPWKKKAYPAYSKTDTGYLELIDNKGNITRLERGDGPITSSIPAATYREVFAMTPDDLRSFEVISSGDIKNRFLTIPGGKNVKSVLDKIDKDMLELLTTDRRSSNTEIGQRISRLKDVERELAGCSGPNDRYDDLFRQRSDIEDSLSKLNAEKARADEAAGKMMVQESQKQNISALELLQKEISGLSESDIIGPDDKTKYDSLKNSVNSAGKSLSERKDAEDSCLSELKGYDPKVILKNGDRIKDLSRNIDRMNDLLDQRSDAESRVNIERMPPRQEIRESQRNSRWRLPGYLMIILSIGIGAAGILLDIPMLYLGFLLAPIGVYLLWTSRKDPESASSVISTSNNNEKAVSDLKRINENIASLNEELNSVLKDVGIPETTYRNDVRVLSELYEKSKNHARSADDTKRATRQHRDSELDLKGFLAPFGGEERFLDLYSKKNKKERLIISAEQLKSSIDSSGYDPNMQIDADLQDPEIISKDISALNKQLGEIKKEMELILDDDHVERLMDERASLLSEIDSLSKKWGMLSLASSIIDITSEEAYSDVQPDVVQTADRYIRLMTDGRYGLNTDLRSNDITVISEGVAKTQTQWSSGLGDQIKLSIKMAVAKELSEEDLPILLDDVLLMFDHERKKGGCAALADLSKDMQVLLFTCDRETRDLAVEAGGNLIEMGSS